MYQNVHGLEPFTSEQYAFILVSGANTDFQLYRVPYANPAGKAAFIKELAITNGVGAAMEARFYDADLQNTAVPTRGSGSYGGCLMVVGVPASATSGMSLTTVITSLPTDVFQGGIVVQCSQTNARVAATIGLR